MGETTQQIENHLQDTREDLKSNIQELESRVKSAADWRQQFERHPGVMLSAAIGGGVLLSMMLRKTSRAATATASSSVREPRKLSPAASDALRTWDTLKSALVGVAATKVKGALGEIVPGFNEHLEKAEERRTGAPYTTSPSDRH